MPMERTAKIYVAGHTGLVGSAIQRALVRQGYQNLVLKTSSELDLRNQQAVEAFFAQTQPDYVFLAAAKVGGILANATYPAEFIYDNLMIQTHVIHSAYRHGVRRLLFLGSSCIYPKHAPQPLKEEYLLTGLLEETNAPYAVAKIAGIQLCEAYRRQYGCEFIAAMPTNLYGPNDNYDLQNAHVLPALLRKFHEAKVQGHDTVTVWGTGGPKRELMHADDLAEACCFLMQHPDPPGLVNIGTGEEVTIRELAELIQTITGFTGTLVWDETKPDGTPQKRLDLTRLRALGFQHRIGLAQGITDVYKAFQQQYSAAYDTPHAYQNA